MWSTGVDSATDQNAHAEGFVRVISDGAKAAAAGNYYSIVLRQDGTVVATGKRSKDQYQFSFF